MMNNLPSRIDKLIFCRYVKSKLVIPIHAKHIMGVVNILFDELLKDFKSGKNLRIHNFGKITLEKRPRKHRHITLNRIVISPGKYIFRFFMPDKIKRKISSMIDVDKTFGKDK
jgi:nucleoid DNA-binding protein